MSDHTAENAACDCIDWPLSGGLMHAPGCPAEPDQHPCGHASRTPDCGGCDPGAIEFVRDDSDRAWRRNPPESPTP